MGDETGTGPVSMLVKGNETGRTVLGFALVFGVQPKQESARADDTDER
jgi:hypothetical protein